MLKYLQQKVTLFRIFRILLAAAIPILVLQFNFYSLEFLFYDARFRASFATQPSGHIEIVRIGKETIQQHQGYPTAGLYNQFLVKILAADPHKVVFTSWPFVIKGSTDEQKSLAQTIEAAGNRVIFQADDLPVPGDEGKLKLPAPLDKAIVLPGPVTRDSNKFAEDNVSRRVIIADEGRLTSHAQIASHFNGFQTAEQYRGTFDLLGSLQAFVDFRPTGVYPSQEFLSVLNSNGDLTRYKGKVVLVGPDALGEKKEYVTTPYSREVTAMPAVEMHANFLDTLIQNRAVLRANKWVGIVVTLVVALLVGFVVFSLSPVHGVVIIVATILGYSAIALGLFAAFRLWIPMAHPILTAFLTYYLFIPYRLIQEHSARWEYQQKNRLLTQVEELKTNFLSMMSHDLKTPLARIQGMVDIALQGGGALSPQQKEALTTISQSTEELSVFISSILNLGRIESKEIKLNIQSKDINLILDDVIRKLQFLAKQRGIEIITEFEPLFSIKVDVDLMRQVFSNLIENAIKYSRDGGKVLVSTEESENHVIIQVADQGIGIPEGELTNIFMKFYRSKEIKNTPIKGSGLGLYLAKYFVELHHGVISVESVHQQGSTFTVRLPMEQKVEQKGVGSSQA